ncbi:DUF11 domain-containing protein [Glaciimonas soli]|uniref:DUF11 domain-containing protein n=1 Tax=Glaciimonas soli TaxID=2590999 RepID=A0A843YXC3_9BURK|nr:DUF11 domain-containing protein [Glaciimonas soli]MQR01206.1 DUF11 domain-containing protein [Glaciimonas soli]
MRLDTFRLTQVVAVLLRLCSFFLLTSLFVAGSANAAFISLNQPFTTSSAPGWVLGGSARLTAGAANNNTGTSGTDASGSGYLRLTDAVGNKQGYAYYNQGFATNNGIVADFDYMSWGGSGADGMTMFMVDASQPFANNASYGGGLGYCNLSNAMIGVGLDEYGNFSNPNDNCGTAGGGPGQKPESVVLRGPASTSWGYLGGSTTGTNIDYKNSTTTRPSTNSYYRHVHVVIAPQTTANQYLITVSWMTSTGGTLSQLISQTVNLTLPANAMVGFAGSTGGSTNVHEIRNLVVTMVNGDLGMVKTAATTSDPTGAKGMPGDQITYTLTLTNNGGITATGAAVTDVVPSNITGVTWTCAATTSGATCGAASGSGNNISTTANLNSGAVVTYTVKGTIAAATAVGTTITNTAKVTPPTGFVDVTPANNTSSVSTTVVANVTGTVYNDLNRNAQMDSNEVGTGLSGLYVTLTPSVSGVCQSSSVAPAAVAAVSATNGTYSLPLVPQGSYCLILTNKSTLPNTTATIPSGWAVSESLTGIRQLTIGTTAPPVQNFGLYSIAGLSGTVFADTGIGGGTANDGVQNGSEAGIANVTINAMSGSTVIATTTTAGNGSYTLVFPTTAVTNPVTINEVFPAGYIATGGSAGTTGGTYTRGTTGITNGTSFTYASGGIYSGVNFANVPVNTFSTDGAQTSQAGTTVFYTHTFVAGSGGTVTFSSTALANPVNAANTGWVETIYNDTACSATVVSADPILLPTTSTTVTAGQTICLIVKEFIPATAPLNATNAVTVSANFNYTNASPALTSVVTHNDVTTVGTPAALTLLKQVRNITQNTNYGTASNALPGDTLQYQLTATNQGSAALNNVVVSDTTPSFTNYVIANCPTTLPTGLTACTVSTQPAVGGQGAVQWTFTGSLAPTAQTMVTYQVKVSN